MSNLGVFMSQKYNIVDAAEDAAKFGYSVGVFGAKLFYQVSGLDTLGNAMDSFVAERFRQRLEYFTHEHDKISDKEKKTFYDNLKNNPQNLNYLYEFIEKARMTTYELHAKLLARLSVELVKNNGLTYFDSSLLSNLDTLNDEDILFFFKVAQSGVRHKRLLLAENIFIDMGKEKLILNKYEKLNLIEDLEVQERGAEFHCNELTEKLLYFIKEIIE